MQPQTITQWVKVAITVLTAVVAIAEAYAKAQKG